MGDQDLYLLIKALEAGVVCAMLVSRLLNRQKWIERYLGRLREDEGLAHGDLERAVAHWKFIVGLLVIVLTYFVLEGLFGSLQ